MDQGKSGRKQDATRTVADLPNPFMTSAHCYSFARRMADVLGTAVHVLRTPNQFLPRRVVTDDQLKKLSKDGILCLVESSAIPEPIPERPDRLP